MDNNIFNRLSKDAIEDGYLNELLFKLVEINHHLIFKELEINSLTKNEFLHLLRFADIMSCSDKSEFRNHSLQIISLMYEKYKNDEKYNMTAIAIFSKLGSFFSIDKFLISSPKFKLPIERDIEANIKKNIQIVPFNEDYILQTISLNCIKKLVIQKLLVFQHLLQWGNLLYLNHFYIK